MILFINTAFEKTCVALFSNGAVVDAHYSDSLADRDIHSRLNILINKYECKKHLRAIALISGPGSYTGLRLAFSAAKGLCFALDIPILTIHTLEAYVEGLLEKNLKRSCNRIMALQQARHNEFFWSAFSSDGKELAPPALTASLESTLSILPEGSCITGHIDPGMMGLNENYFLFPQDLLSLSACMKIAERKMFNADFSLLNEVQPLYIKEVYFSGNHKK